MSQRSSLDPIAEAHARTKLRYQRAKPVHPGTPGIGKTFQRIARKALPKKAATLSALRLNWEDIVGPQLAQLCRPEKLTPARGGRKLTLRVIPAAAPIVAHQSELIRQRVSVAAGGDITKVQLVHGAFGPARQIQDTAPAHLSETERAALLEQVRNIKDNKLRAAIVALGEAVLVSCGDDMASAHRNQDSLPF